MNEYIIKQGNHYSGLHIHPLINPRAMTITRIYTESCLYDPDYDDGAINKLGGFCIGFNPKGNSIRIGWRASKVNPGKIEEFWFYHRDGVMQYSEHPFQTCEIGQTYMSTFNFDRHGILGFRLNPYFGGNKPALKDVHVFVGFS